MKRRKTKVWADVNPEAVKLPPNVTYGEWAMCAKKHRYRDQERAVTAASRSARRAGYIRTYECPRCKGWHLTHKRKEDA